ncbi:Lrp/AsnC family transcriptional regulator [Proteiniphilum sp. UBA1028]|jgi:Lrp/AsnC family transcriptional regulator for asnA, asnC and gidA|uniref:Lrp/AsnC family transcriptional regulator n=1 Tax=Proteiniphilum sp. UBA1028 TaxID=1947251 RepID=UPI000E9EC0A4|nr:Lrp/AsnC ligand binding domain-containing protein [Proteiniphilum sp. UBA1028]HBG58551.1 transcriptional regulator [Porphyromonadaceae bacterium]
MAQHELDELDEKILRMIVNNARIPFLEVARECDVSGAAIHQRVQKLTNLGVVKGSEFVVDAEKIGYETCAFVGIFLTSPSTFEYVVKELEKIPEVVECYYTTGQYDLLIKVYAKNNKDLLRIIHTELQPLGLSRTETLMCFKDGFRKKLPIDFTTHPPTK